MTDNVAPPHQAKQHARVAAGAVPATAQFAVGRARHSDDLDTALRSLTADDQRNFPDLDVRARDDADPLIEEGEYDARALRWSDEVFVFGKRRVPKFVMWLPIIGPTHNGAVLKFFADLPGGRRASQSAKYRRAWQAAAGRKAPKGDRLSPRVFKDRLLHVRVGTSKKSGAIVNHYSVVTEILRARKTISDGI